MKGKKAGESSNFPVRFAIRPPELLRVAWCHYSLAARSVVKNNKRRPASRRKHNFECEERIGKKRGGRQGESSSSVAVLPLLRSLCFFPGRHRGTGLAQFQQRGPELFYADAGWVYCRFPICSPCFCFVCTPGLAGANPQIWFSSPYCAQLPPLLPPSPHKPKFSGRNSFPWDGRGWWCLRGILKGGVGSKELRLVSDRTGCGERQRISPMVSLRCILLIRRGEGIRLPVKQFSAFLLRFEFLAESPYLVEISLNWNCCVLQFCLPTTVRY
jgi:hypothetical protein